MAGKEDPNADLRSIGIYLTAAAMLIFIIWFIFNEQIKSGIRWLRIGEMQAVSYFLNDRDAQYILGERADLLQIQRYLSTLNKSQRKVAYEQQFGHQFIYEPSAVVARYTAIPTIIFLSVIGLYILFIGTKKTFNRKFNLETLLIEQSKAFPVVAPMMKFNPVKANARRLGGGVPTVMPMMAEALSPQEWIAFHAVSIVDARINRNEAKKAFQKQLIGRWRGASHLPIHLKVLFVAFSMKVAGMRTEADEFLGEAAKCWDPKKGLCLTAKLRRDTSKALKDPKIGRVTDKVAAQHAFIAPAMLRILHMAREQGGVLAPATFLWLRAVDRTMWYPLNNLGRGSFHVEALAAMAHYKAERAANRSIPTPQVDTAVDGLQTFLNSLPAIDIPPRDYSKGKAA